MSVDEPSDLQREYADFIVDKTAETGAVVILFPGNRRSRRRVRRTQLPREARKSGAKVVRHPSMPPTDFPPAAA